MLQKLPKDEIRSIEQLRKDYEIEKELADRLRNASPEDRGNLYSSLYNELFERTPLHSQLVRKQSSELITAAVFTQMTFLKRFLDEETTFLEVGSGDCELSLEVAKHVTQVFAIDVSTEITKNLTFPDNFHLFISDGRSIPVPAKCISVAYSNQLMVHMHPDDAYDQLQNIYKSLIAGGVYICITPNRLNGPHDISRYFDRVATGFHLKEYTTSELVKLFQRVGFSSCDAYVRAKGMYFKVPDIVIRSIETLLRLLPYGLMSRVARSPLRIFLGIRIVGKK